MKKSSKILVIISCLFLVSVFFVPLWYIKLDAPQYPGGLDMFIWINKITGTDEFTLQNINILNHYIGMEAIHPDSFAELRIMPYVLGFFIVSGFVAAFLNNKKILAGWVSLLIIGGTVGLIDFYLWQQAFGNNLDPQAPIKIEGMTYSPPFLGIKTILNIKATSFPHLGGLAFALALFAGLWAVFMEFKSSKQIASKTIRYASLLLMLTFVSCRPEAQPIAYGFDACEHCKMTITDNRYGTELVTKKGKVYKFDSIECLAMYEAENEEKSTYAMVLVTDYLNPGNLINAEKAWYLQSKSLPSPMGMNLTAFGSEKNAWEFRLNHHGKILQWEAVQAVVNTGHEEYVYQDDHQEHQDTAQ